MLSCLETKKNQNLVRAVWVTRHALHLCSDLCFCLFSWFSQWFCSTLEQFLWFSWFFLSLFSITTWSKSNNNGCLILGSISWIPSREFITCSFASSLPIVPLSNDYPLHLSSRLVPLDRLRGKPVTKPPCTLPNMCRTRNAGEQPCCACGLL